MFGVPSRKCLSWSIVTRANAPRQAIADWLLVEGGGGLFAWPQRWVDLQVRRVHGLHLSLCSHALTL
jgi:hypothetical protein